MRTLMVVVAGLALALPGAALAQTLSPEEFAERYVKQEHLVPMRDGAKLMTQVFVPRDAAEGRTYPIIMNRTPYSVAPYGVTGKAEDFSEAPGSLAAFLRDGFIIARQDVRGRHMSEGTFVNMTPHVAQKRGPADVDESTDTYDTIEWLLGNIAHHNGRVGQWGISYPGFYASAGMINAHPALKAVSPQAPIADWWFDDFYHRGCFLTPHFFGFFNGFGRERPKPVLPAKDGWPRPNYGTQDGYDFFLALGPLGNMDALHYRGAVPFYGEVAAHPTYDDFWQARNILPHLKKVAPAVMVVGGWFDAEDLYGALNTYRAIEEQNPGIHNTLVMGPWGHGDWGRREGSVLGDIAFGERLSDQYQQQVELPFFRAALKEGRTPDNPEAMVFDTGLKRWRSFGQWPPAGTGDATWSLAPGQALGLEARPLAPVNQPAGVTFDEFVSDPAKPVPYTEHVSTGMVREYMTEDQRFAGRRPEVLVYTSPTLTADLTIAGPIEAELFVSTTGTDADWIVKVIDVYPGEPGADDRPMGPDPMNKIRALGGYQMMVRSECVRGRFREGFTEARPFTPGEVARVPLPLQDVLHTFKKGHRVMVQVQSTWFPLIDRNPQTFVPNLFKAVPGDFVKQTHRVHLAPPFASTIRVRTLPADPTP
ncbi:MAG: CocE/NonD family hydrolase [Phycisphaerales bacterium]